jgi:hypothetical protein
MKKTYRTNDEKTTLVNDFIASGKSKNIWCKENNIPVSTFLDWLKKYSAKEEKVTFVPLKIQDSSAGTVTGKGKTAPHEDIIIESDSLKIHVSKNASISFIKELLEVVKSVNV